MTSEFALAGISFRSARQALDAGKRAILHLDAAQAATHAGRAAALGKTLLLGDCGP
jgi:hypothetical protein